MSKHQSKFRGRVGADAQRQRQTGSSYGHLNLPKGVKIFKEEEGKMYFDILPYVVTEEQHPDRNEKLGIAVPGEVWYKRPYKLHRNIGSTNDSYVCPTSIGKRCPICEYRTKRIKEGAEKEETDPLKASLRNLYIVLPIGHKEYDEVPHIWDISQYLFQNLLNKELEENEEYEIFPDLEEGYTLKVRFDEQTMGKNKFFEVTRIDFEKRDQTYEEEIMDDIPALDNVLTILSYKELEKKFMEIEDEDEATDKETVKEEEIPERIRRHVRKEEVEEEKKVDEAEDIHTRRMASRKPSSLANHDKKEEVEEEPEEEKKTVTRRTSPPAQESTKKDKCPHGHKFGVDTEKYDICDSCDVWEKCIEEKERNEK